MFGYLNIDKSLDKEHSGVFYTFNCGMCLSTKKLFGNVARLGVGHDINTFNILFHSYTNTLIKPFEGKCIMSPFKSRLFADSDEITDNLAVYNVLLLYYKLLDNFNDERDFISKAAVRAFRSMKEKACERRKDFDTIISRRMNELYELEKRGCSIIDEACHPFAALAADFCQSVLGDRVNEDLKGLCYNTGKWIYLIDALDDFSSDIKKGGYNPIKAAFGGNEADKIVRSCYDELQFIFYSTLNYAAKCFNDLNLKAYSCVLKNVFHVSMRSKTEEVFNKYMSKGDRKTDDGE